MLLVNCSLGPSKIDGFGLIAREFIPKGKRVWTFNPHFDLALTEAQVRALSAAAQDQVIHYAFFDSLTKRFILSSDDDRFTNHNDNPSTHLEGAYGTVAVRNIEVGEEVTCDYREFEGP
jgi:uncharacterized protein